MTTLPSSKLKFEEAYPNDWDVFNAWHAVPVAVTREEAAAPAALPETINGAWYRHSKGGVYRLLGEATHTETKEALVVYADQADRLWARPRPMFVDGRFTLMHEGEPADARSLLLAYVEGHIGPPHTQPSSTLLARSPRTRCGCGTARPNCSRR